MLALLLTLTSASNEAARGKALYAERCVACHGPALQGGAEGPPLVGLGFVARWDRQRDELFAKIRRSMPQDDPGTLSADEARDLLAVILRANRMDGWP